MERNLSPRRRAYDLTMRSLVWLSALLTCALLVFLIGYIFYRGAGSVTRDFLTGTTSYLKDTIGILPNILNTLYIVLLSMAIVLPLGVGAAIYLTEYAANRRVVELIEFATETLTGIPSIIFGLVGMLFFVQKMDLQAGVLAGSLTLVVMILPTIVRTTQESLRQLGAGAARRRCRPRVRGNCRPVLRSRWLHQAGLPRRVAHGGRLPVSEALRRQRRRDRRELPNPHFPLRRGSLFPALAHGREDPLPAGRHGLRRTAPVHRVRRRARRPRDAAPGVRDKLTAAREETKKASEKGRSLPFSDAFCMAAALHRAKAPTGAVVRSACFCGGLRGGRCAARSLSPDRCAQGYPCAYK